MSSIDATLQPLTKSEVRAQFANAAADVDGLDGRVAALEAAPPGSGSVISLETVEPPVGGADGDMRIVLASGNVWLRDAGVWMVVGGLWAPE